MARYHTWLLSGLLGLLSIQKGLTTPVPVPSCEAHDSSGAVTSESALCSRIGIEIREKGGNAGDMLISTTLCIGVTSMYHSGIGGGGFMILRFPNGTLLDIDFRETAPAAAFEDMYKNNVNASMFGGLASGVPGELRALELVYKKAHEVAQEIAPSNLTWKDLVAPAVKVAREGFPVNADLVRYMDSGVQQTGYDFLTQDPTWAIDFAPNGTRLGLGDTIARKRYADTLEIIGEHGVDAFYTGAIANATITALQNANGTMTLEDLRNYTVALRTPSQIEYRGQTISACSAPSGGVVALSVMKILEGYDMSDASNINLTTHRLDEAIRFGYGQRSILGDPSFVDSQNTYQQRMLDAATAKEIRGKIFDDRTQNTSAYDPKGIESLETPGTSHITVVDATGFAISSTTTINLLFGSTLMVPETGVIMNNEMNDFSIPGSSNAFGYVPNPSNYIRPGKRPLSSISPVIVTVADPDGSTTLRFVAGSAGGSRIITAVIQLLWNVLDRHMTVVDALAAPRLHDQLIPNQVVFEYGYDNATTAFMRERGHNVTFIAPGQSTANGVERLDNGTFRAGGEPRQKDSGGFAV